MTVIPIMLVLDISGSMEGEKINELEKGVNAFIKKSKKILKKRGVVGYVSIIEFNDKIIHYNQDNKMWLSMDKIKKIKLEKPYGATHLGTAIIRSIQDMEQQLVDYRNSQVTAKHPTLIVFTDGIPFGENEYIFGQAIARMKNHTLEWNVISIACGIDDTTYIQQLSELNTISNFNNGEIIYAKDAKEIVKCLKFVSTTFNTMDLLNNNIDTSDSY